MRGGENYLRIMASVRIVEPSGSGATVLIMQLTISRSSTHIFRSTDPVTLRAITQVSTYA